MDPCSFVRILVGNLALNFPVASKPSFFGVQRSTLPCFCKIKLKNFPTQYATVPLVAPESQPDSHDRSLAACFTLNKTHIDKHVNRGNNPVLEIEVYSGRRGITCGFNRVKLLGTASVEVDLPAVETRANNIHQGWVGIGGNKKGSSAELYLSVRAEPDPRFVFQFDGEPECSPQVFQVHGDVRQPVFSCKFGFKNVNDRTLQSWPSMGETSSTPRSSLMGSHTRKEQTGKQRRGWHLTIHDLSGSVVAVASMVTPFVPSRGSHRVSQSSPGAWLILRPEDGAWNPWGRLEAWRESGGSDAVGYRFELITCTDETTILTSDVISSSSGGKFSIDRTSGVTTTPTHTPNSSCDLGSSSRSTRGSSSGSGSGLDIGYGPLTPPVTRGGFVMSSTVDGAGKCSKPEVEVGVRHVTCAEDAATYVALAAAMDLSMDACGLFSKKLRKELRQ